MTILAAGWLLLGIGIFLLGVAAILRVYRWPR